MPHVDICFETLAYPRLNIFIEFIIPLAVATRSPSTKRDSSVDFTDSKMTITELQVLIQTTPSG